MRESFFIIGAFLILYLSGISLGCAETLTYLENTTDVKWSSHIEFELRKGNKRNLAEAEFFIPLKQDDNSMVFADIRGMQDNSQNQEGNIGIGYREIVKEGFLGKDWVLGSYAFLDVRNTEADNKFIQATFGLEALTESLDMRTNFYIPQGKEKEILGTSNVSGGVAGNQLRLTGTGNVKERALPGFDIEFGYKLPFFEKVVDAVKIYGGGYYFDADDYKTVAGPRGRLELQWRDIQGLTDNTRFTLGAEIQRDDVRETAVFGMARLRVPLYGVKGNSTLTKNPRELSALERRMTERVIRDVDIVSGAQKTGRQIDEPAKLVINGEEHSNVVYLDATDNVPLEIANAGAGSVILLDGAMGQIDITSTINLQPNQTLVGAGVPVYGSKSRVIGAVGIRPVVNDAGIGGVGQTIFADSLGDDFTVQGIDVVSDAVGNAFVVYGADEVFLKDINVTGGATGMVLSQFAGNLINSAVVEDVNVSGTGGAAFGFFGGRINLKNITTSGGTDGMLFFATSVGSVVDGATLRNPSDDGVDLILSNMNLSNVNVFDAGDAGFELDTSVVLGSNNTSENAGTTACRDEGNVVGSLNINQASCLP